MNSALAFLAILLSAVLGLIAGPWPFIFVGAATLVAVSVSEAAVLWSAPPQSGTKNIWAHYILAETGTSLVVVGAAFLLGTVTRFVAFS